MERRSEAEVRFAFFKLTGMIQLKEIRRFLLDVFPIFLRTLRDLNLFDRHSHAVATHRSAEDHAESAHAKNLFFIHIVKISEIFGVIFRSANHFE